jgi:hypothetical protein
MAESAELDIRVQWHSPDGAFAAVLLRDGEPWFLDGACVGMGRTRGDAVNELAGIARYLVVHGENFLTDGPLSLADREWLFRVTADGPDGRDPSAAGRAEMRAALAAAREAAG